MDWQGQRVLVVGMARSGVAVAGLLANLGADVTVNDSKPEAGLGGALEPLKALPVTYALGCPAAELLDRPFDTLVISPGISINAPFVREAAGKGIRVTGEIEVAASASKGTLAAITGTNGKTTTTTLLGEIGKAAGRRTHVVGNIGYPFAADAFGSAADDLFVCEISSFQMETAETFHPHVAALLNITEDHLNRHGTMEEYTRMKMRVFRNQTADDIAVFNADDPALAPLIGQVKSHVMLFSRLKEVDEGGFVRDGRVIVRLHGQEHPLCLAEEIYIPGPHNLENALAAACMAVALGLDDGVIISTLKTFKGVEHRIEFVRELGGVRYINDSKGTNPDSTIKAIQTMNRPTVIILGGYDKHSDFTAMAQEMRRSEHICEAVLIGVTADQLELTLRRAGFPHIHRAGSMEEAVRLSASLAGAGWNVLLSPACASFDMFSDYEQRGRVFKDIVNRL